MEGGEGEVEGDIGPYIKRVGWQKYGLAEGQSAVGEIIVLRVYQL